MGVLVKALVTGAAGFVGRHMTAELQRRGWNVARCDTSLGWDALDVFASKLASTRYDLVVHAAAVSPHRAAIDGQPETFLRNMQLDAAMFDWAVRTGQGRVLYLSSSAVYPVDLQEDLTHPLVLHEDAVWLDHKYINGMPDTVYGWTKLTGEKMAAAARRAGLRVTVVRPFSGYGEDQSEDFPFRALIERARRREDPFTIWGDGSQVRDWIHIDDVVAGALAVVESGTGLPVNLCTGDGLSMLQLARLACDHVGHDPQFELRLDKPAGVAHRVGDPTRLRQWYLPTVDVPAGVRRALDRGGA